jgi:hypothetical protein
MKKLSGSLCATSIALGLLSVSALAANPKLQTLHSFTGGTDGASPVASLAPDASGNLYGTTMSGGTNIDCLGTGQIGCGVVFELSLPKVVGGVWKETILYRFSGGADGARPYAGLVFDEAGNLYGTTIEGGDLSNAGCSNGRSNLGCGVVFELSPQLNGTWRQSVIHTFEDAPDGAFPAANLILDAAGNLYGTAQEGGDATFCGNGCGTVFELTPNGSQGWTETTIYQFQGASDGGIPVAGLTFDQLGNLYGTTSMGTIFELTPPGGQGQPWSESVLALVSQPEGGVIFDTAGNLYGTSNVGSGEAFGGVFELSPTVGGVWNETTLYAFGQGQSSNPKAGLTIDKAGNLYGTASGRSCGAVYRLENENGSWNEAELDFFKSTEGPCQPVASLIVGKLGALYGTSLAGGTCTDHNDCGTAFGILP